MCFLLQAANNVHIKDTMLAFAFLPPPPPLCLTVFDLDSEGDGGEEWAGARGRAAASSILLGMTWKHHRDGKGLTPEVQPSMGAAMAVFLYPHPTPMH